MTQTDAAVDADALDADGHPGADAVSTQAGNSSGSPVTQAPAGVHLDPAEQLLQNEIDPADLIVISKMDMDGLPTREDVLHAQQAWLDLPDTDQRRIADARHVQKDGEGILTLKADGNLYVPNMDSLRWRLVIGAHQGVLGHRATKATLQRLRWAGVSWPTKQSYVKDVISKCLHCKPSSIPVPQPKVHQATLKAKRPWELLHADVATMDFCAYTSAPVHFVILRDDFSGLTWTKAVPDQTASQVCPVIADWLSSYPPPAFIASDSGPSFRNNVMQQLRTMYKMQAYHHLPHNHKANGSVEVAIRYARQTLLALRSEHASPPHEWHLLLPLLQTCLNSAPQPSRGGLSAMEIAFGRRTVDAFEARLSEAGLDQSAFSKDKFLQPDESLPPFAGHVRRLMDALDRIHRKVDDQRLRSQSRPLFVQQRDFAPGTFVLYAKPPEVRRAHPLRYFQPRWTGPYQVLGREAGLYNIQHVSDKVDPFERRATPEQLTYYCDSRWSKTLTTDEYSQFLVASGRQFRDISHVDNHKQDGQRLVFLVHYDRLPRRVAEPPEWVPSDQLKNDVFAAYYRHVASTSAVDAALTREARRRRIIL